jgi:nicotinamide phosphoribosyltransferase
MSRGAMFPLMPFVGLHPKLHYLKDFLQDSRVTHAQKVWHGHFGNDKIYNLQGWLDIFKLGYLPLSIKAVPEGTVVPTRNVLMTIENTDPRFPWLTNWVETLLMQVWYPITVAAQSRDCKILIRKYLELTGCDLAGLDYKLHDFGFRGVTCIEQAMIGGGAHLGNFRGTDTGVALDYLSIIMPVSIARLNVLATVYQLPNTVSTRRGAGSASQNHINTCWISSQTDYSPPCQTVIIFTTHAGIIGGRPLSLESLAGMDALLSDRILDILPL